SRCGGSSSRNSPTAVLPGMTSTRYAPPGRGSSVARIPIQRVAFSGSTRNSQTVSGVASIASSRSTTVVVSVTASTLLPLLSFGFPFECFEAVVPELVEERLERREPLRAHAVETPRSVPTLGHESRLLQERQVLRDRRPRDVEPRRDLAGRQLGVANEGEDLPTARPGDCSQGGFHGA